MSRLDEIEERLIRAGIEPTTFAQHAKSDMRHLLNLVRAPFDPKTVYRDNEGHLCVPLVKKPLN